MQLSEAAGIYPLNVSMIFDLYRSSCSPIDYDCWQHTAEYIDQALIVQLRHYSTAQVFWAHFPEESVLWDESELM